MAASNVDYYNYTKAAADALPKDPGIVVVRAKFAEIELGLLDMRKEMDATREKFKNVLDLHANPSPPKASMVTSWQSSMDVMKLIYSFIRDRAYDLRDRQLLKDLNKVHAERVEALKTRVLTVFAGIAKPPGLLDVIGKDIAYEQEKYALSEEMLEKMIDPHYKKKKKGSRSRK